LEERAVSECVQTEALHKKELLLATQYRDCHGPELNEPITSKGGIDAQRTSKTATPHKTGEERRAIQVDPERRSKQLVQN